LANTSAINTPNTSQKLTVQQLEEAITYIRKQRRTTHIKFCDKQARDYKRGKLPGINHELTHHRQQAVWRKEESTFKQQLQQQYIPEFSRLIEKASVRQTQEQLRQQQAQEQQQQTREAGSTTTPPTVSL